MKQKNLLCGIILTTLITLSGCGNVSNAKTIIGSSEIYSRNDIEKAMNVVSSHFVTEFSGCSLLRLEYDEKISSAEADEWAAQYQAEEAIVLMSDYKVDSSGGDGSLQPNSTYQNWKWILTRSQGEPWKMQTWGYG